MHKEEIDNESINATALVDDVFNLLNDEVKSKNLSIFHRLMQMALRIRHLLRLVAKLTLDITRIRRDGRRKDKEIALLTKQIEAFGNKNSTKPPPTT